MSRCLILTFVNESTFMSKGTLIVLLDAVMSKMAGMMQLGQEAVTNLVDTAWKTPDATFHDGSPRRQTG